MKEITSTMTFRDEKRNYITIENRIDIRVAHAAHFVWGDSESVFGGYPQITLTFHDDSRITLRIARILLPSFLACVAHVRYTTWEESKARMRIRPGQKGYPVK